MTLDEFIIDLKQQPWELEYVQCVLTNNEIFDPKINPNSFINTFRWSHSPNVSIDFWRDLHETKKYAPTLHSVTLETIKQRIKDEYKDSHPEFLI